jgi:hypothetical protein
VAARPALAAYLARRSWPSDFKDVLVPLIRRAAPRLLPVVHVEYALSEADYFTSVAVSTANADLAYEYLIGHARWFGQPPGQALLGFLAVHLGG